MSKPSTKQRFERHRDVQRWIHADRHDQSERVKLDSDDARPAFDPAFLSDHHERDWLLSSLATFYDQRLIDDILSAARSGKEATVYGCKANPATGYDLLAAKIYRPRMFRNLRNDAIYRESRISLDGNGQFVRHRRTRAMLKSNSAKGRTAQVASWIIHEYKAQERVHIAGGDVPLPIAQAGNAILMEFIGDEHGSAPLLHQADLGPEDAREAFDAIMANIEIMLSCHVIHGDLSSYNILYWDERPVIIDLAQALDPRYNHEVLPFLERDIDRVCRFFARFGIEADPPALANGLWQRYIRNQL